MKQSIIIILLVLTALLSGCVKSAHEEELMTSLDFGMSPQDKSAGEVNLFPLSDGGELAFRYYPAEDAEGTILLVHGGGAHSASGYLGLAESWALPAKMNLYFIDLRGHGASSGKRGDSPTTKRVYQDMAEFAAFVSASHEKLPLILAGHSSGAGFLLNYSTSSVASDIPVEAYYFISPFFGFRSHTEREPSSGFSKAVTWPYVINSMSAGLLLGHYKSVKFAYPEEVLEEDPLIISSLSVNLSNALTPSAPARQLAKIQSKTRIWIGSEDEMVDPEKLETFVSDYAPLCSFILLPGVSHLGILDKGELLVPIGL